MKNKLFILGCSILLSFTLKAQMKVGDNPTAINSASLLELETTNKGLVFPRVSLTDVASPSPLPAGLLTGTVVYNTNAAIANGNGIGLYLWGGSVWMSVNTSSSPTTAWSLTGNAATSYATNFIGTTDNVGFRIRTNNLQRILVDSLGSVAIGSTAFNPNNRERLLVDYGTTTSHTVANFRGSINDYFQINIQNTNGGIKASSDYVATADDGTDSTFFVDMGINGSHYAQDPENWGTQHDAYFYSNSKNLLIGTQADSSDIYFLLGGGQKSNTALQINGPQGTIVVGKGDNLLNVPVVGNTIRGPNANITAVNLAGGDLELDGGRSTGTAKGGNLSLNGGATSGSGTGGNVNITGGNSTSGAEGSVLINGGSSTGSVRIGGTANNILLPKFTTVGGLYYTSKATGQLSTTGANMTWDSINNRLGIGTTAPGNKLSVIGENPLYLGGVKATSTFNTDSILTINAGIVKKTPYSSLPGGGGGGSGWLLAGNSGTNPSTNFLGTTDQQGLTFRVNNAPAGFLGVAGSSDVTSLGAGASAGGQQSTALGAGAVASQQAVAVGYKANASDQSAIAIGNNASVNTSGGIAMGVGAITSSQDGIAIGDGAKASSGTSTLAIGTGAQATAQNATAFGHNALAPAIGGNAFGNSSNASGSNSIALGTSSTASGNNAITIGDNSSTAGTNSIVLGYNSSVAAGISNTIVIGDGLPNVSQSNVLILGNSNKTVGISTTTPNANAKLDVNGPFKLGTLGTVTKNSVSFSRPVNVQVPLGVGNSIDITFSIPGRLSGTQATVAVSPDNDLPNNIFIAFARVLTVNQVTVRLMNSGTATIPVTGDFYFTITEF